MLRRAIFIATAVLCGAGTFAFARAQQPKTPPDVTRDTDRDGVPDVRDRCPGTPAGARVDANGCPLTTVTPTPPPAGSPAAPAASGAITQQAARPGAPTAAAPTSGQPTAQPSAAQPAGAQPAGAAAAPTGAPTTAAPAARPAVTGAAPGAQPTGAPPSAAPAGAAPGAAAPAGAQPSGAPNAAASAPTRPAGAPAASGAAPTGAPAGAQSTGAAPGAAAPPVVVPPAPAPITLTPGGQPAQPSGAAPANARPAGAAPSGAPPGAAPGAGAPPAAPAAGNQPARTAPSAPAPSAATVDNTLTEGFLMRGWVPNSGHPVLEYLGDFALKLDSAAVALRGIFSTASGQPVAGATDPNKLVSREKLRWRRCRNIKEDIQTFADNVTLLQDSVPESIRNPWATLGERFDSLQTVLENCETIAFMIESPERYQPWQTNYETSARAFYLEWYGKLKAMHDALRGVIRLVAAQLPVSAPRRQTLQLIGPLPTLAPTPGGR